jgi:hypothetical protein
LEQLGVVALPKMCKAEEEFEDGATVYIVNKDIKTTPQHFVLFLGTPPQQFVFLVRLLFIAAPAPNK